MRLVLDNVDQGFVTVDRAGWLTQMSSRIVETWLGPPTPRIPFADWLLRTDPNQLAMFNLGWDQLMKGELPRDLLLDQLPRRVEIEGKTLAVAYKPIEGVPSRRGSREEVTARPGSEPRIGRMLVVITDVTGELARVRAEQGQRELASVMERYGRDRSAALTFFEEARAACSQIGDGNMSAENLLRGLHTLKGNARLMGLMAFSTVCHDLESVLVDEGKLSDADRARLRLAWEETEQRVGFLLGAKDKLEINEIDFAALTKAVERGAPRAELLRLLEACRSESVGKRLEYFADQARRIAESLEKLPLDVTIEAAALNLPRGTLAEFWSAFVHVIRNAVDHGLEDGAARLASAKPETRRLVLRARVEGESFLVEVEDDGRGMDWETIFTRAHAAGLPTQTREDLVRNLCAGGITTRSEVSELSGRGIGMKAVRDACTATSGALQIQSEPGRGTLMRFRWGAKALGLMDESAAATAVKRSGTVKELRSRT
jgi:HPt (histidine-containing phosphotransfer) domain-containing protein